MINPLIIAMSDIYTHTDLYSYKPYTRYRNTGPPERKIWAVLTNVLDFFWHTLYLMPWFFLHRIVVINTDTNTNVALLLLPLNLTLQYLLVHLGLQDSRTTLQRPNVLSFEEFEFKPTFIRKSDHLSCCLPLTFSKLSWLQISKISTHSLNADIKAEFSPVILLQSALMTVHKNYWSKCRTLGETEELTMKYPQKTWQIHKYFKSIQNDK